jgi:hypothetical protein
MKHWGSCALVLWVFVIATLLLTLMSCGNSKFYVASSDYEPDVSRCKEVKRAFTGNMFWTPWKFRFSGTRSTILWARKPEHWNEFDGQVYLQKGEWDVDWVDELRMSIEPHPNIATWDGQRWEVDSSVNVAPLLKPDGDEWLFIEPEVYARGTKPAGNPKASVTVTFAVCGPGSELIR